MDGRRMTIAAYLQKLSEHLKGENVTIICTEISFEKVDQTIVLVLLSVVLFLNLIKLTFEIIKKRYGRRGTRSSEQTDRNYDGDEGEAASDRGPDSNPSFEYSTQTRTQPFVRRGISRTWPKLASSGNTACRYCGRRSHGEDIDGVNDNTIGNIQ